MNKNGANKTTVVSVSDCRIGVSYSPSPAPTLSSLGLCPLPQVSAPQSLAFFLHPDQSRALPTLSTGLVMIQKKSEQVRGTHLLEWAEFGTPQDTEKKKGANEGEFGAGV